MTRSGREVRHSLSEPIDPGRNCDSVRPASIRSVTRFASLIARWLWRWVLRSCAAVSVTVPTPSDLGIARPVAAPSRDGGGSPQVRGPGRAGALVAIG